VTLRAFPKQSNKPAQLVPGGKVQWDSAVILFFGGGSPTGNFLAGGSFMGGLFSGGGLTGGFWVRSAVLFLELTIFIMEYRRRVPTNPALHSTR
jgi:hypothetical protein